LALTESVDAHTSLVLCDDPAPEQGKGYQACELGVPMLGSAEFMLCLDTVIGGSPIEEFSEQAPAGDQFTLF
ncbi:DNA polymerase III subunit epsilon, partial [Mycobacterium sp. ITM-2017-0098]